VRLHRITVASEAQSEAQKCFGCLLFQEAFSEDLKAYFENFSCRAGSQPSRIKPEYFSVLPTSTLMAYSYFFYNDLKRFSKISCTKRLLKTGCQRQRCSATVK